MNAPLNNDEELQRNFLNDPDSFYEKASLDLLRDALKLS